ncbi:CCXG family PEP-CTERM protein [Congregibacter brevis]|uniref:CCXG family PEP-CTERM protein n=1 Tax=Congregibacter brevis TaxID=3081201 RepID=A0ABZ0IE15_9GAMM|nr:CCXG family PEP-CTERM protein [Congregibacter sp. IMCC45268]
MRYSKLIAGLTLTACSSFASAGLVIESINVKMATTPYSVDDESTFSEAKSAFDTGTQYCDKDLEAFTGINSQTTCGGSNGGYGALYTITGSLSGSAEFQFGMDWGRGGFIRADFDDAPVSLINDDIWWAKNWNKSNEILTYSFSDVGSFSLTLLGFEGCCDGINSAQYRTFETGQIAAFNDAPAEWQALEVNAVPVPGSLPLMAIGALLVLRRRQQK